MSKLFEQLVKQRGFSVDYLKPKYETLADPFLLPDMKKAVDRIRCARDSGEKILIYGDYDADGVTASTVMKDALELAGVKTIEVMLPDRFRDGYGMSNKVVQRAKEMGATLVVTVDCGSGNKKIVDELMREGIETIVTDHHECPAELPDAVAVVNPKRKDGKFLREIDNLEEDSEKLVALRDLAGVGVAFMVAKALEKMGLIKAGQEKWLLDLVLIGTICDSMNFSMENRLLCYYGMKVIGKTRRVGLKELLRRAGIKKMNGEAIGFMVGPRINAAGRMANAKVAFDLINATNKMEAAKMAETLEDLNTRRRNQQTAAMTDFRAKGETADGVLVATGDWHEGILGIIAGKMVEEYHKPAFALSMVDSEDGKILKGSGRSFGDFNLAEALKVCEKQLVGGGGHAGAAGVKLLPEKLAGFRTEINEYYESLKLTDQERFFEVRADIVTSELGGFTLDFLDELELLEPFGVGNELPVFELEDVWVLDKKMMGADEKHMRLMVRGSDEKTLKLVAFNATEDLKKVECGEKASMLVNIEENEWNGLRSVQGRILAQRGLS